MVNAFRLLIISTTISLIMLNLTNSMEFFYTVTGDSEAETQKLSEALGKLFTDWYNLFLWLSIPVYAFFSFLLFKRYEKFNYAEHLVIISFFVSVSNILTIVFLPFGYFIGYKLAFLISFTIGIIYYFFLLFDLFRKRSIGFLIRIILCLFLSNAGYFILLALSIFAFISTQIDI